MGLEGGEEHTEKQESLPEVKYAVLNQSEKPVDQMHPVLKASLREVPNFTASTPPFLVVLYLCQFTEA